MCAYCCTRWLAFPRLEAPAGVPVIPRRRHSHFCVHSGTYGANSHRSGRVDTKNCSLNVRDLGARLAQFASFKPLK